MSPLTSKATPSDAHSHIQVVPCSWQQGGPIILANDKRTNSWHNRGFAKLLICTERRTRVIEAFIALANAVIVIRRLICTAWTTHRWDTRPSRRP